MAHGYFRSPGRVPSSRGARRLRWGCIEVRHLVGVQKPEEGLSSHSFHSSEEPGLRLRSRAAMLPWKRRVPLSLTAGITVIGGWGWEEDVSLAAPRVGARRSVTPPPPSPFSSPFTVEASSQQEVWCGCRGCWYRSRRDTVSWWGRGEVKRQGLLKEAAEGMSF